MKLNFLNLLWPINSVCALRSRRAKDVPYGEGPRRKLDIYGRRKTSQPRPVVMFWYGGSWKSGGKKYYSFVADYVRSLGAVCVVVDYPLFPKQTFPGFIDDASLALAWVKSNISQYGGDPDRIYLMGHSSGGHTALITALKFQRDVKGCIPISAPDQISRRIYGEVFGQAFETGAEKPIHYIKPSKNSTRFLIIHGSWDRIVPVKDGINIDEALQNNGYKSEILRPRMGHMRILSTVGRPLAPIYREGRKIKEFIG